MAHEPDLIDIYSASWGLCLIVCLSIEYSFEGPVDDGKTVDGPRLATMKAIVKGINEVIN